MHPVGASIFVRSELKYDDGSHEDTESRDAGYMLAVRFNLTKRSLLQVVKFYIDSEPATFEIHVMNSSYVDLIEPFEFTPISGFARGWLVIHLPRRRMFAIVEDEFIVALKFVSSQKPVLRVDTSSPIMGRSEIYDGESWMTYPGNLMIRAQIIYYNGTSF